MCVCVQESVFFFLILILGACCLCCGVRQYWERVVFGVVGLFGGVGRCFLSCHDVQSVVDILESALLSLVFVVNAVLVGTKLLRLDKVS